MFEESKSGEKLDLLDNLKTKESGESQGLITSLFTKISSNKRPSTEHDEENSPKKKPKHNGDEEKVKNDGIFNDYNLFVAADTEISDEDVAKFKKLGGLCTNNSFSANLVLHKSPEIDESLDDLRKLYQPQCRHYQASWLRDTLKDGKLKNPAKYFVKLHQI